MAKRTTRSKRSARQQSSTSQTRQEAAQLNILGLIISAVALAVLVLFFVPWIKGVDGGDSLSGLDVASRTIAITEDFPGGIVFILPLVVGSVLFQYYRRIKQSVRPRRRLSTFFMLIIGLITTVLWVRHYTINATEWLNEQSTVNAIPSESDIFPENRGDTPLDDDSVETASSREAVTTGDVLREQFEIELWLHLALSASLLILPFLDDRPEAEAPQI